MRRWLAGDDGPGKRALPAGEFLSPAPLAALAILAINDHWLKGSGVAPGWLTGKLSDLAGLVFFPLLATAALDTALLGAARLGARIDFSLRPWKLSLATSLTALAFAALKLVPSVAGAAEAACASLGWRVAIACDPTDLVALPALLVAWWLGDREIARVPLGRLEALERLGVRSARSIAARLDDVARRREPRDIESLAVALAGYFGGGDPRPARDALRQLRQT